MRKWLRLAALILVVPLVLCVVAGVRILAYPMSYDARIYPGISIHGVDVGGLTVEEATGALVESLPDPAVQVVQLRAGEHLWQFSWTDAGQGFDYAGMVAEAYQIAHQGPWYEQVRPAWQLKEQGQRVDLVMIPADRARVVSMLEQDVAPVVFTPPVDAQLQIGPGGAVAFPSQVGQELDVEASAARVLQALAEGVERVVSASGEAGGVTEVELVVTSIPPRLSEPEPAYSLARSLLAQPFTLVADDPLTDYYAQFAAPPERVATWLRVMPEYTSDDARVVLEIDQNAVRVWLLEVASQLGDERLLDVDETLPRALAALDGLESRVEGRIRHPEGVYVVQPGDFFFDIAYSYGFPQWRLEEANPDVDPEALAIGMELVMPSIDVLFPEPLVPGKRIEIDLPEQRLRAYENEELVFDFICSSGMSRTPTIAGQFQVLFKEPSAYASRWSLDMPYFMAIYQEGPEYFNGMHELPITSGGWRLWSGALGWPASYGCIILDVGDAEALYNWAPVGTLVRITGVAPGTPVYTGEEEEEQP
jgi:hypothetical protein